MEQEGQTELLLLPQKEGKQANQHLPTMPIWELLLPLKNEIIKIQSNGFQGEWRLSETEWKLLMFQMIEQSG